MKTYEEFVVSKIITGHRHILAWSVCSCLLIFKTSYHPCISTSNCGMLRSPICDRINYKSWSHHSNNRELGHTTDNPSLEIQLVLENIGNQGSVLASPSRANFDICAHNRADICFHCFGEGPEVKLFWSLVVLKRFEIDGGTS